MRIQMESQKTVILSAAKDLVENRSFVVLRMTVVFMCGDVADAPDCRPIAACHRGEMRIAV